MLGKMAEMVQLPSVDQWKDYKDIGLMKREIRDPSAKYEGKFMGICIARSGCLLVADYELNYVCVVNKNGNFVNRFRLIASEEIMDICELPDGKFCVTDRHLGCFSMYTEHAGKWESESDVDRPMLEAPCGLAVSKDEQIFVVSKNKRNLQVSVYNDEGKFQHSFKCRGQLDKSLYSYVCISNHGLVYITDCGQNKVHVFKQDGEYVHHFGSDTLDGPTGIAATEDGHLIVASRNGKKLSIFTTSGECVNEVKDVGLIEPFGVAVDASGLVFVADGPRIAVF